MYEGPVLASPILAVCDRQGTAVVQLSIVPDDLINILTNVLVNFISVSQISISQQ